MNDAAIPWVKCLLGLFVLAAMFLMPRVSSGQQCEPEACAPLINAAADTICYDARLAEEDRDEYRTQYVEKHDELIACQVHNRELLRQLAALPDPKWSPPVPLLVVLRALSVAGVTAGALVLESYPKVGVGLLVLGGASFTFDLALEFVR